MSRISNVLGRLSCLFFTKAWFRTRLRQVIRGHREMKLNGSLGRIAKVQHQLTVKKLGIDSEALDKTIFGQHCAEMELSVRQYLLLRVGVGFGLNAELIRSGAGGRKIVWPLPIQWVEILESLGFRVSRLGCAALWSGYVCAAWAYGFLQIVRITFGSVSQKLDGLLPREPYVLFANLGPSNLPRRQGSTCSHDILSWYLQWSGRDSEILSVRHTVPESKTVTLNHVTVRYQSSPLLALRGFWVCFKYLRWGIKALFFSLIDIFRGRWWNALLLNQAALRMHAELLPRELLAEHYYFHNSDWFYRPLWTYGLNERGIGVSLYFYSTNCEGFKTDNGYPLPSYGYGAMNWPHYLVWDQYQAAFVRRCVGDTANITEVGPIWFSSSSKKLEVFEGQCIALFDVTPVRYMKYCEMGVESRIYTPEVVNKFVLDVLEVSENMGLGVVWKRKRNVGRWAHSGYRFFIQSLDSKRSIKLVDPDVSASRVIEASKLVVSLPFTSTALIAKYRGVPSAYYDPLGIIQKDDRAAHGVEVLTGRDDLRRWIKEKISVVN